MVNEPYQVMPALSAEEYDALRADIAEHGIRVPVDVDEQGQILDGHHRAAIASELGIDYPTRVVAGLTEDDKRHHAVAVNAHRRMLTREQRRQLVAAELERDPSRSDRAIARIVGVDHKTVAAARGGGWGIPHPKMTREEAERISEHIAGGITQWDRELLDGLLRGVPPAMLASAILDMWRRFEADNEHDAELLDPIRRYILDPRLDAVLGWPDRGAYAEAAVSAGNGGRS